MKLAHALIVLVKAMCHSHVLLEDCVSWPWCLPVLIGAMNLLGAMNSFTVALWRSWNSCQDCTWHLWADPGIELATSGSSGILVIVVLGPSPPGPSTESLGVGGYGLQLHSDSPRSALAETSGFHVAPTAPYPQHC